MLLGTQLARAEVEFVLDYGKGDMHALIVIFEQRDMPMFRGSRTYEPTNTTAQYIEPGVGRLETLKLACKQGNHLKIVNTPSEAARSSSFRARWFVRGGQVVRSTCQPALRKEALFGSRFSTYCLQIEQYVRGSL